MNKEELQKQIESIIREEVLIYTYVAGCWGDECHPEAEYDMYDVDYAAKRIVDLLVEQ